MLAGLFYMFLWFLAIVGIVAAVRRRRRRNLLGLLFVLGGVAVPASAQDVNVVSDAHFSAYNSTSNTVTVSVTARPGWYQGTPVVPGSVGVIINGVVTVNVAQFSQLSTSQTVTFVEPAPLDGASYDWIIGVVVLNGGAPVGPGQFTHVVGTFHVADYQTSDGQVDVGHGPAYDPGSFSPTAYLPGDLTIGIPGVGDIGIPSGWPSLVMQYAMQQVAQATGLNPQAIAGQLSGMMKTLQMSGPQLTNLMQNMQMKLLTPNEADTQGVKDSLSSFVNWGPYSYVSSIATAFHPSGLGTSAPAAPATPALSYMVPQPVLTDQNGMIPIYARDSSPATLSGLSGHVAARATASGSAVRAHDAGSGGTDGSGMATDGQEITSGQIGIPVMGVSLSGGVLIDQNGHTSVVQPGQWYDSGRRVPFDFSSFANAPAFQVLRQLMGAGVYISFAWLVILKMWPKQEF